MAEIAEAGGQPPEEDAHVHIHVWVDHLLTTLCGAGSLSTCGLGIDPLADCPICLRTSYDPRQTRAPGHDPAPPGDTL